MNVTPLRQSTADEPDLSPAPEFDNVAITSATKLPRGRSTIDFPYVDLEDAASVARMIFEKGGLPLERDQLAAAMGHPVSSGAFLAKLHGSRMFGLIEFVQGKSKLTDLGFAIIDRDEVRAKSARAEAFLNVPLFARAYLEFRNKPLPPRNDGLEQAFIKFGVLETRKQNARWAFDRSARQAGFFEHGEDRLVQPIIAGFGPDMGQPPPEATETKAKVETVPVVKVAPSAADDLLIRGLLARMPQPEAGWPLAERARWLRALAVNLAMLYGNNDEVEIQIAVPTTARAAQPTRTPAPVRLQVAEPEPKKAAPQSDPAPGGDLDDEIPF